MSEYPLYFDYAATTPVDERVIQVMVECLGYNGHFGNPASSGHAFGRQASERVELARQQVAALIAAQPDEIIWTSGATESNNLALKGVTQARAKGGGHIITSQIEHKAILDTVRQLQATGVAVTYLAPDADGLIHPDQVRQALQQDTFLVSLMLVNNELGTVSDIPSIGKCVREHGALLHVDGAQAAGKLEIRLDEWAVDLMSFSAHKVYGPKGIGALYVGPRARCRLLAQIHGGGHESGLRSGTLATHQIVGMGRAFALAGETLVEETTKIMLLRQSLLEQLAAIPGVFVNGSSIRSVPHTLSLTFSEGPFNARQVSAALACSVTSACNSRNQQPSHVLSALGMDAQMASRTIRLSLGRFTCEQDIDQAVAKIKASLSDTPFWMVAPS